MLEFIIKSIVAFPEDVKVARKVDEMGVLLSVDCAPEDMGKIIGREGNTAKAIRTILRVVGMKNNARINIKINEPVRENSGGEDRGTHKPFEQALEDIK